MAQAGGAGGGQSSGGQAGSMLVPMLIFFAILYFMLIRPQQRREKERQSMITQLKQGDRVVFCGGILGTVVSVKETTLVVKTGDNVKMEVLKSSVSRTVEKGEKAGKEEVKS